MKNYHKTIFNFIGIFIFLFSFNANSLILDEPIHSDLLIKEPEENQTVQEQLKGTWHLKEDPKSKLVFTLDKVHEYYDGNLFQSYSYTISETSPQCDENVPVGPKFNYIKWTNAEDENDIYCYEINTLNDKYLALIYIGGPNFQPAVYEKLSL